MLDWTLCIAGAQIQLKTEVDEEDYLFKDRRQRRDTDDQTTSLCQQRKKQRQGKELQPQQCVWILDLNIVF